MAHFYASIQGGRGEATRTGTKASGIGGHIRGWNVGVKVESMSDSGQGDEIAVFITTGSNRTRADRLVGQVRVVNGEACFYPVDTVDGFVSIMDQDETDAA